MTNQRKTYFESQLDQLVKDHYLPEHYYIQVRQSKTFMERYLAEKIELERIASSAFMSRFHFIRMFKRIYGVSPRQYLRDLRMSQGKKLLKQGRSVAEVCVEVGYESIPTFSNAFKKATGYAPKEYQRLHNSNPE